MIPNMLPNSSTLVLIGLIVIVICGILEGIENDK